MSHYEMYNGEMRLRRQKLLWKLGNSKLCIVYDSNFSSQSQWNLKTTQCDLSPFQS